MSGKALSKSSKKFIVSAYKFYEAEKKKGNVIIPFEKVTDVTPVTIETAILTHPGVAEVMVTGVPDEIDGEHPIAVIIPKPGVKLTENEIVEYVDERLSDRYKLRAGVIFVKDLPKTPGGKLRRALIRQKILKGEF